MRLTVDCVAPRHAELSAVANRVLRLRLGAAVEVVRAVRVTIGEVCEARGRFSCLVRIERLDGATDEACVFADAPEPALELAAARACRALHRKLDARRH